MSWRPSDRRRAYTTVGGAVCVLAVTLAACGGRDAWLQEPLPKRGPVYPPAPVAADAPRVRLQTTLGDIVIALYPERAPITCENFLRYVREGFYDGTIFHRVVWEQPGPAVVQGGGFTRSLQRKPTHEPIRNEATNGLSNLRGTVAMARGADPHSATSQFFINYLDNDYLDHRDESAYGYAVFGVVVEGMEIVDRMSLVPTRRDPATGLENVPMVDLVIERARLVPAAADGVGG